MYIIKYLKKLIIVKSIHKKNTFVKYQKKYVNSKIMLLLFRIISIIMMKMYLFNRYIIYYALVHNLSNLFLQSYYVL